MATFDQLGDAAASVSNRLRRSASIVPEGTVGRVKKTKARFSGDENPFKADQTLRGAGTARPEFPFQESYMRQQQGEAVVNRAAAEGRALSPDEIAFIEKMPGNYPDLKVGQGPGRARVMTGKVAQEMADSRPYGRRMLDADQPDLGLGEVAQKSMSAELIGTSPTGTAQGTTAEVYKAYLGNNESGVYDLPDDWRDILGESTVDTRGIPYRQASKQGYGYEGSPYRDLDAIPLEDRALATGNPMDTYLQGFNRERSKFGADPELMYRTQEILDQGGNPVAPFGSEIKFDPLQNIREVESVRQGNELTIDTLGGGELSRRLRQQNPEAYSVIQDKLPPVANPVQQDFRAPLEQVRGTDAAARLRSAQLDEQIMAQNAAATGADTTNFTIKDVNPDEYYLYGSQKDTQGLLPDEVSGLSRTYGYQPSESLVNMGFSSKQVKPIDLAAGKVGLGVDITNKDPYSRAAVVRTQPSVEAMGVARDPRYVPVDPITPIDLELPGVRYAEKSGLQAGLTPELAIAEDQRAAARLRAIADLEQTAVAKYQAAPRDMMSPDMQRRAENAYNAIIQSDALDSSAANMQNAMRIANEQTVPHPLANLTRMTDGVPIVADPVAQGRALTSRTGVLPGTYRPDRLPRLPGSFEPEQVGGLSLSPGSSQGIEMPFEEALEVMKPYRRGGAAEQVLRLPVVPTVAPEQAQLSKRLRLAQQVGDPLSASIITEQAQPNARGVIPQGGIFEQIAQVDPSVQVGEIRRGVQYTMVPTGETGQGYKIRLDNPGQPVTDPATGQRMIYRDQPIETYNPREQAQAQASQVRQQANYETPNDVADPLAQQQAPVEFATRARATRPQLKQEERGQLAAAINEGYVPKQTGDPYDRVMLTGDDLSDMRGGLSAAEALQGRQFNLARQMSGLPPVNPAAVRTTQDSTINLIRNPPAQGGVFTWGADDYGYGSEAAARFPSSGPPIEIQSGGMLNSFMTEPMPARTVRPTIRQVQPTAPLAYRPAPQVPGNIQPARIQDRPDLDWQRSPSFRFPQNVWQGSGRVI